MSKVEIIAKVKSEVNLFNKPQPPDSRFDSSQSSPISSVSSSSSSSSCSASNSTPTSRVKLDSTSTPIINIKSNVVDYESDSNDNTPIVSHFDSYMDKLFPLTTQKPLAPSLFNNVTNKDKEASSSIKDGFDGHESDSIPHDSDYDSKSETSTISSSPITSYDMFELDEALLDKKFSAFAKTLYKYPKFKLSDLGEDETESEELNDDEDEEKYVEQDDNEENEQRAPLIRSTSLRTGKTPPNTPERGKKMVRFADALGLEFEYVKLISQDEIPSVPRSAFSDLKLSESEDPFKGLSGWQSQCKKTQHILIPEFIQPSHSFNFYERVRNQRVSLESCEISTGAGNLSITCYVRVMNVSFEKQVIVRHTLTEWQTWTDSLASYLPNSCDGWSDKFVVTFSIRSSLSGGLRNGQRVLFAIRYLANNEEYWDNNVGLNYSLIYR